MTAHTRITTISIGLTAALLATPARGGDMFFVGTDPSDYWSDPTVWIGGVPGNGDAAHVGASVSAQNSFLYFDQDVVGLTLLSITDGMAVRTNEYYLSMPAGNLFVSGENYDAVENLLWPSRLYVENSAAVTDGAFFNVTLSDEGSLILEDDATASTAGLMLIEPTAGTYGLGTWNFQRNDPAQLALDNQGFISGRPGTSTYNQVGASKFDLDGSDVAEDGQVRATIGAINSLVDTTLMINGTELADDFDGEMQIHFNGRIDMNLSSGWTLGSNGLLRFSSSFDNESPTLGGDTMTVLGTIDADARNAVIEAPVVILNGSHTIVQTNDSLTFTANTVANTALFSVNDGGTLNFNGPSNLTGNGYDLYGGTLTGAIIINSSSYGIRGFGTVENRVINDGMIYADGGILLVNGTHNDWDGPADTGELRAMSGDLHLTDNQDATFAGDSYVFPGHEIFIDGFSFTTLPGSYLYNWNGTLRSTDLVTIGGQFDAVDTVDIDAPVTIASTATVLSGNYLNLNEDAFIQAGASISAIPNGMVVGGVGATLELDNNAVIDADVQGKGDTLIDAGIGEVTVNDNFFLIGNLEFQLGLPSPTRYDHLYVADTFEARGHIDVVMVGYEPQLGDEYDVLDFTTFNDLGYTMALPQLPAVLDWDVSDFETQGILRVAEDLCPADVDDDGVTDINDLLGLLAAWGSGKAAYDITDDGIVDINDLLELLGAWGNC